MHAWSQLTSLVLAFAGFVLAAIPRPDPAGFFAPRLSRHWPAAPLLRSPAFWCGLALLPYIAIQGLNPAWRFFSNEDSWWLEPVSSIAWLPSGVDAPFERSNPWRQLVVLTSLGLLVASLWIGFTRRRSYHALFAIIATNAGMLALYGIVQRLSGVNKIFGFYESSNQAFAASFIYPNHAGAYFDLMVSLLIGLAAWHHRRAGKQLEGSGKAIYFGLVTPVVVAMIVFTRSRLSVILVLLCIAWLGGAAFWRSWRGRAKPAWPALWLTLGVVGAVIGGTLGTAPLRERFGRMVDRPATAVRDRTVPDRAASEMLRDYWTLGWGAGCFRYGFPKYTRKYPEIHQFESGALRSWEHAHNDFLEFSIELGLATLLPAAVVGAAFWNLIRRRFWRNALTLGLVVGCLLTLVHGSLDFVFQNPAILLSWSVLLAAALRWTELDQPRRRTEESTTNS